MAKVDIDSVLLISLVEGNPVIWDKTLETYKTRAVTKNAWNNILPVLISDYESLDEKEKRRMFTLVIQKWTHIRDSYFRSIKKIQEQKIEKRHKTAKPYLYSKRLSFLQKVMNPNLILGLEEDLASQDGIKLDKTEDITKESVIRKAAETTKSRTPVSLEVASQSIPKRPMKKEITPIDAKMMKFMESFTSAQGTKPINRHISFFTGILPTLDNFDEDEVLEFQVGVLKLIKSIKRSRQIYYYTESASASREFLNSLKNPLKIEDD